MYVQCAVSFPCNEVSYVSLVKKKEDFYTKADVSWVVVHTLHMFWVLWRMRCTPKCRCLRCPVWNGAHALYNTDLVFTTWKHQWKNGGNLNHTGIEGKLRTVSRVWGGEKGRVLGVSEMQLQAIPDHSLSREHEFHMELLCGITLSAQCRVHLRNVIFVKVHLGDHLKRLLSPHVVWRFWVFVGEKVPWTYRKFSLVLRKSLSA